MTNYWLIKKNGESSNFSHFADLYNAFLAEYGYPTLGAKLVEFDNLYYQGK